MVGVAAFATAEELRLLLRDPTIDQDSADLLLQMASDTVLAEIRQVLSAVADDEVTLNGTGTCTLLLPEVPVTGVTSVTVDGTVLVGGTDYTWSEAGVLTRLGGVWSAPARSVVVVYDHGHTQVPGIVRTVVLQAAARVWVNPRQLSQESLADYSRSFGTSSAPPGRIQLTDYERGLLAQLKADAA